MFFQISIAVELTTDPINSEWEGMWQIFFSGTLFTVSDNAHRDYSFCFRWKQNSKRHISFFINHYKNHKLTKKPSISTSSPLFLRLPFPAKNQNPQQTQPPPPPITRTPAIMIGQCQDSTNKNRKLAVSAGHRPDGEGTKKDTQRSRGSRVTWKPVDAGFFIAALWPHSPLSMRPQTTARFSFIAACHLPLIHAF